ncbi:M-phase inducer phosphatase [Agrilus planipennis]|uniref:protein-tyrosine-phosphatase n=1 Tax=Agrilus planipennis TaxID=224129 RepID=A0A1W4X883_AGRPL|nr:M-phase inducer phosphatase [Agrilus planipennis]
MWDSASESFDVCHCSRLLDDCKVSDNRKAFCSLSCNKENVNQRLGSPVKHDVELSLYDNNSPQRERTASTGCNRRIGGHRRPLVDYNPNSHDSGYGTSSSFSVEDKLNSFGSIDSLNDEFLDFSDMGPLDENCQLPGDFSKLMNGRIQMGVENTNSPQQQIVFQRPQMSRSISLNLETIAPGTSRARSCLFTNEAKSFKRPNPPANISSPSRLKRCKLLEDNIVVPVVLSKPTLQRSASVSEDVIKSALQKSSTDSDLIGDFTKTFSLPLVPGRHPDLKSISSSTLALLMEGSFSEKVNSYKIIDCRYPYEFDGGHITGAQNIFTKDQIMEELLASDKLPKDANKRNILIFHCEFSSERGPTLYRFLRNLDRIRNNDIYPSLHYPEIYLLEGGYKNFYEQFSDLCTPQGYKPMAHPEHQNDLRHFRAKAKSCNADKLCTSKGGMKRFKLSFM